ncbi:MAG: histidine phosphatase family protein [Cyclobacteriaceae bacterium]
MVKQLLIVRHAEARESQAEQRDFDRNLTPRGYQDAVRVGDFLKQQSWQPDLIICSSAVRAKATAQMIAEQLRYSQQRIQAIQDLYDGSLRTFLAVINKQDENVERIMAVGHNPTVSYLLEYLTGDEVGNVVPGGLALVKLTVEQWAEVSQRTGSLLWYKLPQNLT